MSNSIQGWDMMNWSASQEICRNISDYRIFVVSERILPLLFHIDRVYMKSTDGAIFNP